MTTDKPKSRTTDEHKSKGLTLATLICVICVICVICGSTYAQQIGNPTTQDGVLPPRGVFAIRNARIVTGIGVVSPVGSTLEEFWPALVEARSGIGPRWIGSISRA